MAKLLIADTNFSSGPIREYLLSQGHEVHIAGGNPNDFLAKGTPNYHVCDYSQPDELKRLALQLGVDAVLPGCNDQSYFSCAQLAHGIAIDTPATTLALADKQQFRRLAAELKLPTALTFEQFPPPEAFPIIVKPANAYSGHGISILQTCDEGAFSSAMDKAKAACREGKAVAEQFIEGQLYSHSAFLYNKQIVWDVIAAEYGGANPFVVDTSYVMPAPEERLINTMRDCIETLAKHLGLIDGLIHTQFIANDKQLVLIEITRRCPGDLYSHLIKLSTGFNYVGAYADALLGLSFKHQHQIDRPHRYVMRHTVTSPTQMRLSQLRFNQPLELIMQINLATTGEQIAPSPRSRISLLFSQFKSQQLLEDVVVKAVNRTLYSLDEAYYLTED